MASPTPRSTALARMFTMHNLLRAWESVSMKNAAPGIDGVTVEAFARNWRDRLGRLQDEILAGGYRPQPLIVFPKQKKDGGVRELVNCTVRDKIVARAAADELTRQFDRVLLPQSYAYRPHKGALKAVSAVERHYSLATHAVRADIEDFFDTLDHPTLHRGLVDLGVDEEVAAFLVACAGADRFDGVARTHMSSGVPQGSPLAPILSNLYLHPLDQALDADHYHFVRYADDILVLAGHPDQANGALGLIQEQLGLLRLSLSVNKTRVHPVFGGFVFLGFLFGPQGKTACREARQNLLDRVGGGQYCDETEDEYLARIESIRRGWANYYGQEALPATDGDAATPAETDDRESADSAATLDPMPSVATETNDDPIEPPDAASAALRIDPAAEHQAAAAPEETQVAEPEAATAASEIAQARQLWQQGFAAEALQRLRRQLNNDDIEIDPAVRRQGVALLADIYAGQGLHGAARRCRQAAGVAEPDEAGTAAAASPACPFGPQEIEHWLALFGQGQGSVARQYIDASGRHGYRPTATGLTAAHLRDHWEGRHTLAVPVYGANDLVHFGLLDLDLTRRVMERLDADQRDKLKAQLLDDAVGLVDLAHRHGVDGVIEDSGCKGYHVWFFFHEPLAADLVRHFLLGLDRVAGPSPEGTHRELFPASAHRPPEELGVRIKLPLGMHRLTGRRSAFLNADGSPASPIEQMGAIRMRNRARQLKAAIDAWAQVAPPPEPEAAGPVGQTAVATLERQCGVLRAIAQRAAQTHALSHYERTVLRGILAPLGDDGRRRAHEILRQLDNYDHGISERMLRAAPSRPLGCARIREILGDFAAEAGCACVFKPRKGQYANPLRHLTEDARSAAASQARSQEGRTGQPSTPASPQPATRPSANRPRPPAAEAESASGTENIPLAEAGLEALLRQYHNLRGQLLAVQQELLERCGEDGCLRLPLGTLRAAGADSILKHWSIEL